jgi:hypothetical protein
MGAHHDLGLEILKLLLQVAWADDVVDEVEIESILTRARAEAIAEPAVSELARCLRGEAPLPPPNFGYLRQHREVVMVAAERYVVAPDGHRGRDASEVMETIRDLLG